MFIVLLSFSESFATKCLTLIDEPCLIRPKLVNLNLVELKYYPFMISLDKGNRILMSYPQKYVIQKNPKNINVKVFNMITNKNEAKTIAKHFSCDFKCKFKSTICNLNKKFNNLTCQSECKNYCTCKKDYS